MGFGDKVMGKFGKKKTISTNLNDYIVILLGEPGIGKTSTMAKVCIDEFGEDGYIFLEMSKESGDDTWEGLVSEPVPTWSKYVEVYKDIVNNKETDYPDLKVIVIDTIDQWFELAAKRAIQEYNDHNRGEKDFKPAKSLNAAWGGFGKGEDYATALMLDSMWELKKVGVQVWIIGHTKSRDIIDPVSNSTYTSLTTDMSQRAFNEFKNKAHICAVAYIDRDIQKEKTNRKDIKKKDVMVDRISDEVRKISFRDTENYAVDSKARFENIVDEVPLDAKEFAKAIKDAIKYAKEHGISGTGSTDVTAPEPVAEEKPKKTRAKKAESVPEETKAEEVGDDFDAMFATEEKKYPEDLKEAVVKEFQACEDKSKKQKVFNYTKNLGVKSILEMSEEQLKGVYDLLTT